VESVVQVGKQDVECELTDFRGVWCCKCVVLQKTSRL
jgi:hypothetical protein